MCADYLTFTPQLKTYNIIYLNHSFILELCWGAILTILIAILRYTTKEIILRHTSSKPLLCKEILFYRYYLETKYLNRH